MNVRVNIGVGSLPVVQDDAPRWWWPPRRQGGPLPHEGGMSQSTLTPIEPPRPVRKSSQANTGLRGRVRQLKGARIIVAALQVSLTAAAAVSVYLPIESFLGNPLSSALMTLSFGSSCVAVIDRFHGRHT
jgi:hypothetical protein